MQAQLSCLQNCVTPRVWQAGLPTCDRPLSALAHQLGVSSRLRFVHQVLQPARDRLLTEVPPDVDACRRAPLGRLYPVLEHAPHELPQRFE